MLKWDIIFYGSSLTDALFPYFFVIMTGTVQNCVFLTHLLCLGQEGSLLLYVHMRQSFLDSALIPLVLFCHNLRLPYSICPLPIKSYCLRYKPIATNEITSKSLFSSYNIVIFELCLPCPLCTPLGQYYRKLVSSFCHLLHCLNKMLKRTICTHLS